MNKSRWLPLILLVGGILNASALIGPDLTRALARAGSSEMIPVNILLSSQADNS